MTPDHDALHLAQALVDAFEKTNPRAVPLVTVGAKTYEDRADQVEVRGASGEVTRFFGQGAAEVVRALGKENRA